MLTRVAIPALVAVLLPVAGCGGDPKEAQSPPNPSVAASSAGPEASPGASPKPTAPPGVDSAPPQKPLAQSKTSPSAVDYGRWFAQLVQYTLESRDASVVTREAADRAACSGCRSLATFTARLKRTGYWQVSDDLDIHALKAVDRNGAVRVQGTFTYPEIKDTKLDGSVDRTIRAKPYDYYVDLAWDAGATSWRVRDFYFQSRT